MIQKYLFEGLQDISASDFDKNLCIGDGVFTTTPYFLVDCGAGEVQDDIYGNKGGDGRGGYHFQSFYPKYRKGGNMGVTRMSEAIQQTLDMDLNADVSGVVNSFASDKRTSLAAYLKYSFGPLCRGMEDGDWLREADTILSITS